MKRLSIPIVSLTVVLLAGCSSGTGDSANRASSEGGVVREDNSTSAAGRQSLGTTHAPNGPASGDEGCADCGGRQ